MDCSVDGAEEVENDSLTSRTGIESPVMDRNPSPPPETADGEEDEDLDAIGDTVYSKHWLFSTLTRLIHMVTEHAEKDSEGQMQLPDDDEEDLCRVWDMAMDKDVAGFLQEFKATDILLGVIAKSHCPRLTEICVGILGNIACFPDTCLTLSQNQDLGAVLLLLLGDTDPPTLLETSRLLLTCVSQKDVSSLWLQRIRQQTSVRSRLCFIMCSSTNTDLLEKVGELVDKLFDLDEELMKSWITAQPREEEEDDGESCLDVASCLLEAAKQLRQESPNGLEVYLHALQLLTTIDEGIQVFAAPDGPGKAIWDFVCGVVCEDLCQPNDPPVVLQEQKSILVQAFSVLQALHSCQEQWPSKSDTSPSLIATILRVLQNHSECKDDGTNKESTKDELLQTLAEITAEFLADIFNQITKDTVADLVNKGFLTEKTCLIAAGSLLPNFKTSFQHLQLMLAETDPQLADVVRKQFPD
ncbi:protein SAAL1 [Seriola lalandi dorsalis]|uniref:Serum amyloid A-like 1 n=1 Tax=Seriola lalandi dorsalis TaxID=1841481 RepID=A0A3B4YFH1_SERLL|nr:protein SAAL1 [Seriola lalandi dorsalis]XP_056244266.1 protein saal1 [Seriola aureovittata]